MAAPIIDSIVVDPATALASGQTASITVAAHDPGTGAPTVANVTGNATSSDGTSTPFATTVELAGAAAGPLTFDATVDVGSISQDQNTPGVFIFTAP